MHAVAFAFITILPISCTLL